MINAAFERAMKLAALSGLKLTLGPAFLTASRHRSSAHAWAAAALAEMALDKVPILPNRSSLPLLIPRAVAGAWVARESMRDDGVEDPWAAPMGAAVAAGVAVSAPMVRGLARRVLGVPDPILGVVEDWAALKLGCATVGLPIREVGQIARESVEEMTERVRPMVQSAGAGSM